MWSERPWSPFDRASVKCSINGIHTHVQLIYLNIEQVGFPELDRKDSDEAPLEKKFHPLIISSSDLLHDIVVSSDDNLSTRAPAQYKLSNSGQTWEMLPPALRRFPEPHQYSCITLSSHQLSSEKLISHHWTKPALQTDLHWQCLMRRTQLSTSCGSSANLAWAAEIRSGLMAISPLQQVLLPPPQLSSGVSPPTRPTSVPHMASLFTSSSGHQKGSESNTLLWTGTERKRSLPL